MGKSICHPFVTEFTSAYGHGFRCDLHFTKTWTLNLEDTGKLSCFQIWDLVDNYVTPRSVWGRSPRARSVRTPTFCHGWWSRPTIKLLAVTLTAVKFVLVCVYVCVCGVLIRMITAADDVLLCLSASRLQLQNCFNCSIHEPQGFRVIISFLSNYLIVIIGDNAIVS